ncbi:MAG TPA: glutaredoxin family protein [Solirubrobacter sp.]|nr:glutaredoxin family protein [Solirubrobacter sp.]
MITVFGRPGCAISQMIRRWLNRRGIPYQYVDVELNPQAGSRLAWLTGGRVRTPTVVIGGDVLVQPTIEELEWALRRRVRRSA